MPAAQKLAIDLRERGLGLPLPAGQLYTLESLAQGLAQLAAGVRAGGR